MSASILDSSNPALKAAEDQWLFTEEELQLTPTIEDGWTIEQERECRAKGVNFIASVGVMLRVPQLTLATASVFLHRFYCRHSMIESKNGYHYYSMAATALFLATKIEENCRKVKELVIACCRIAQKNPNLVIDDQSREYWRWRDTILIHEDILLEALCFDMTLRAPHAFLYDMLVMIGEQENKRVRNAAWAFCNDSLLTVNCLIHRPIVIAGASIYFAGKMAEYQFREVDGRKWWDVVKCNQREMKQVLNSMADFYEQFPGRKTSGNEYSNTPISNSPAPDESILTPARTSGEGDSSQPMPGQTSNGEHSPIPISNARLKRPNENDESTQSGVGETSASQATSTYQDDGRERKRQRTEELGEHPNSRMPANAPAQNGAGHASDEGGSEDGEVT